LVIDRLAVAADHYSRVVENLAEMARLFPAPSGGEPSDPHQTELALQLLSGMLTAETAGIEQLEQLADSLEQSAQLGHVPPIMNEPPRGYTMWIVTFVQESSLKTAHIGNVSWLKMTSQKTLQVLRIWGLWRGTLRFLPFRKGFYIHSSNPWNMSYYSSWAFSLKVMKTSGLLRTGTVVCLIWKASGQPVIQEMDKTIEGLTTLYSSVANNAYREKIYWLDRVWNDKLSAMFEEIMRTDDSDVPELMHKLAEEFDSELKRQQSGRK
jgi:hypothetical protein